MSVSVFRIRNFNPDIFTYSAIQTNSFGGKVIYINTPDRKHVHLQTPKMKGSVSKYQPLDPKTNKPTGPAKYSLRLSFGKEPTGMIENYRDILRKWDAKMIALGQENCVEWFKKKAGSLDEAVVKDMYSPMLGISIDSETLEEDGKYPDSVRFKIQVNDDGTFAKDLAVFDEDQKEINNVADIGPGCHIIAIVKCTGIWFAAGKFGISWRVAQMQVFRPQRITGFSILPDLEPESVNQPMVSDELVNPSAAGGNEDPEPDNSSEPEAPVATKAPAAKTVKKSEPAPAVVESESESSEDETESAPLVVAAPTPAPVAAPAAVESEESESEDSAEKKPAAKGKKPAAAPAKKPAAKKSKLLDNF